MRHLMEKTNLTCHLAILDGPEAVYIEKVEPQGFIRMDTWVGRRMRVHATSVGKALVAHIPQERLEKILADSGMEKRTPKTITTVPRLLKDLEKVRAQGYAVDDEENNMGARCLGAPVFNQSGRRRVLLRQALYPADGAAAASIPLGSWRMIANLNSALQVNPLFLSASRWQSYSPGR